MTLCSPTLQGVLSQQRPPLARVQLVASSSGRLLFDHVAPGGPESLDQSRTDPGEPGDVDRRAETTDGAKVGGQSGWREDLQTEVEMSNEPV